MTVISEEAWVALPEDERDLWEATDESTMLYVRKALPRDEHGNECENTCMNCGVPCVDTWCFDCYDGDEEEEDNDAR